jgi:hypothetical protein
MSYNEKLQRLVDRYRTEGNRWPATAREIAVWIVENRLWEPPRGAVLSRCAEEISRAMREEYVTDPQGRRVRAKHAARLGRAPRQQILWEDIRSAPRRHMEIAFGQRREQIVGDCRQLKTDVDSYNENANDGRPIQLLLDFTRDVAELEALDGHSVLLQRA